MKHQFGHLLIILGIFVMALMPISYANAEESDNKDFDFETWHDEAMQAYENFSSLFYSIQDDPTWEMHLSMAEARRNISANTYLKSVTNAKQSDWDNYSAVDIYLWHDTYLVFCDMMNRGTEYFDSKFNSGEARLNSFFEDNIGTGAWTGTNGEELKEAYKNLVSYQVAYYEKYNYPYNFINDKSYADEVGIPQQENEKDLSEDEIKDINEAIDELSPDEIKDFKEAVDEEKNVNESDSNMHNGFSALNIIVISIGLLIVVAVIGLIVRSKSKKDNN